MVIIIKIMSLINKIDCYMLMQNSYKQGFSMSEQSQSITLAKKCFTPVYRWLPGLLLTGVLTALAIYIGDIPWFSVWV